MKLEALRQLAKEKGLPAFQQDGKRLNKHDLLELLGMEPESAESSSVTVSGGNYENLRIDENTMSRSLGLIVLSGIQCGEKFILPSNEAKVGRAPTNEIVLDDSTVSRIHAVFSWTEKGLVLRDLESRNGSFVNDEQIAGATLLKTNDRIRFGGVVLLYGPVQLLENIVSPTPMASDGLIKSDVMGTVLDRAGPDEMRMFLDSPDTINDPWRRNAISDIETLYRVINAARTIIDINEFFEFVLEITMRNIPAEHGAVLIRNHENDKYEVRVSFSRQSSSEEKFDVSLSIVQWSVDHMEGVHTVDASRDNRFESAQSVSNLSIVAALCAPMVGRHGLVGAVYLDIRNPMAPRFTRDHLALLFAIAQQAALAFENTQYFEMLKNGIDPLQGTRSASPVKFYSTFISYSHQDEEFARHLHSRMREEGLTVWFAPEDMCGGQKIHEQIGKAIRRVDKLLLILSESSMNSRWVTHEIFEVLKRQEGEKTRVLFPIRLLSFDQLQNWECMDADSGKDVAREIREYFVPDFSNWRDADQFEKSFSKLLQDLRAEES